jgi:single-strand DNA-binding protein
MNTFAVMGRLTRDVEVKHLEKSTVVIGGIAENVNKEQTIFWDFFEFGQVAQNRAPYMLKGTQVFITGQLQEEKFVNKNGQEVTKYKIKANAIELVSSKGSNAEGDNYSTTRQAQPAQRPQASRSVDTSNDDDDIPF